MIVARLENIKARLVCALQRAPRWVNGSVDLFIDGVVLRVTELIGRWRFDAGFPRAQAPDPVPVPIARQRMLVAPLNFAGQGNAWARAVAARVPGAGAVNLTIAYPGDLGFRTDRAVPYRVNRYSRDWQRRESEHVAENFTHVLVEAQGAIFGSLFRMRPEKEREFLEERGLSVAYICHGSDIRSPRRHKETAPFSPFLDEGVYVDRIQRRVDRNVALLERSGAPVFISTPDLIADCPRAVWVPVVVDVERWAPSAEPAESRGAAIVPRVLHTPSRSAVKGSHLIRDSVNRLSGRGLVTYSEISGVPSSRIRAEVLGADIVLDQFRLGSYGVAACEAMAAGKVVLGHVSARVRSFVSAETGLELPIVEATPATIEHVLADLAGDPARIAELGAAGQSFVRLVHDGSMSASALDRHWLRKT